MPPRVSKTFKIMEWKSLTSSWILKPFLFSENWWITPLLQLEPPCPPVCPEGHCHPTPPGTLAAQHHPACRMAVSWSRISAWAQQCWLIFWWKGSFLKASWLRCTAGKVAHRDVFMSAWRAFRQTPPASRLKYCSYFKVPLLLAARWWVDLCYSFLFYLSFLMQCILAGHKAFRCRKLWLPENRYSCSSWGMDICYGKRKRLNFDRRGRKNNTDITEMASEMPGCQKEICGQNESTAVLVTTWRQWPKAAQPALAHSTNGPLIFPLQGHVLESGHVLLCV